MLYFTLSSYLCLNSLAAVLYFEQIAFTSLVYPALILAYMGQAAYISRHHNFENINHIGFYVSVPGTLYIFIFTLTGNHFCEYNCITGSSFYYLLTK
jgi:hypothetical protein